MDPRNNMQHGHTFMIISDINKKAERKSIDREMTTCIQYTEKFGFFFISKTSYKSTHVTLRVLSSHTLSNEASACGEARLTTCKKKKKQPAVQFDELLRSQHERIDDGSEAGLFVWFKTLCWLCGGSRRHTRRRGLTLGPCTSTQFVLTGTVH